jgi:hypothetical protein
MLMQLETRGDGNILPDGITGDGCNWNYKYENGLAVFRCDRTCGPRMKTFQRYGPGTKFTAVWKGPGGFPDQNIAGIVGAFYVRYLMLVNLIKL